MAALMRIITLWKLIVIIPCLLSGMGEKGVSNIICARTMSAGFLWMRDTLKFKGMLDIPMGSRLLPKNAIILSLKVMVLINYLKATQSATRIKLELLMKTGR